jgi:crossover junction endodeoxyribonuclease RuvC
LSGAIALVHPGGQCVEDMPLIDAGSPQELVDAQQLLNIIKAFLPDLITIEYAQAMPRVAGNLRQGMGATSAFKFGKIYGQILSVVQLSTYPWQLVTPAKWKNALGMPGKDKERSRSIAIQRYPLMHPRLSRIKDHNRAEALMIATYGRDHANTRSVPKDAKVGVRRGHLGRDRAVDHTLFDAYGEPPAGSK